MTTIHRSAFLTLALFIPSLDGAEWPQWRGPDGQGVVRGAKLPVRWNEKENIDWKCDLPGRGWSSPVVEGNVIWLTTAIETKASEADTAKRLKANTGSQPLTVLEKVELRALAVNRLSGKVVKEVELLTVKEPQWVHKLNSYASPTPVVHQGRLYCHFGTLGTACVDTANNTVLWRNSDLQVMHENGPGSSPVLWKGKLIFHMDGSDQQFIAALDADTGKLAWKTPRSGKMHDDPQLKKSYGTPLVTTFNGLEQLISSGSDWIYSYNNDGKEVWKVPYGDLGFSLSSRPVIANGRILFSTGFMKPSLMAVQCEGVKEPEISWKHTKNVPSMSSPIVVGEELYFVHDGGVLTCLNAKTGEENYRERLGGDFSASPTATSEHLYFSDRSGTTTVVKAGRKYSVLATNKLPGAIMASLAVTDSSLLLRTETSLYRISEKQK